MLTRELLRFTQKAGVVRPTFAKRSRALVELADALVALGQAAVGTPRAELEEEALALGQGVRPQKVVKGLSKLFFDRLVFEEPGAEVEEARWALFFRAQAAREALSEGARFSDFEAAVEARPEAPPGEGQLSLVSEPASPRPLAEQRAALYADLQKRRKLLACKLDCGASLLDRYDLATAQGLLLYTDRLKLSFTGMERPIVRRLLGWLRFCRLVAELRAKEGGAVELVVEGPASIFEGSKRYGLQLASFLAGVPLLGEWQLSAEVQLPRRPKAELQLSSKDPLKTQLPKSGYIPEEIQKTLSKLKLPGWEVELPTAPVPVGTSRIAAPDLALVRGERRLVIELFHAWHRGALSTRLEDLRRRPMPDYRLGVDSALFKDAELAAALAEHPQVFRFASFPSARALKQLVAEISLAGPAHPQESLRCGALVGAASTRR